MKQPPFPTKSDLVAGWIDLQTAPEGSTEYEESFWSSMLLDDLVENFPEEAFDVVLAIMETDRSIPILGAIAAGPVEDLLVRHSSLIITKVEQHAKASPEFASMLGGIWKRDMDDSIWERLTAVWDRRGWDGIPIGNQQAPMSSNAGQLPT